MFLESLCRLVNIMSAGNVPTEVAPFLCGASLTRNQVVFVLLLWVKFFVG